MNRLAPLIAIEILPVATPGEIARVAALAREIWTEHYTPMIGAKQVEYMLTTRQSQQAIGEQIRGGDEYRLLVADGSDAGYFAFSCDAASQSLFLSKLYVRSAVRHRGLGKKSVDWMVAWASSRELLSICVTVNKRNASIAAYERWGFAVTEAVVTDIGQGFVMDDYRMQKTLS